MQDMQFGRIKNWKIDRGKIVMRKKVEEARTKKADIMDKIEL